MQVHTQTHHHFTISGHFEGKGVNCPKCGANAQHNCIDAEGGRFPINEVHVERVKEMGHNVMTVALPIHRSKVPQEYVELLGLFRHN